MTSSPDRPFATLSDVDLETRIAGNRAQQAALATQRNASAKRVLAQLRRTCAELIDERNGRSDFDSDYPIPRTP